MSEPTRGHLAIDVRCPMNWGGEGAPCVTHDISNRCDTCNDDGTYSRPTDVPAHSDEWIRETVARKRRNPPPRYAHGSEWYERRGWRSACDAILAALDADQ